MIKTFISYDSIHKDKKKNLQDIICCQKDMQDVSLDYAIDLDDNEAIRQKIRDEFITDASVLIVVVTLDTKGRKFIDWEIAAAMYDGNLRGDGKRNDVCGIVVVDYIGDRSHCNLFTPELKDLYSRATGRSIRWSPSSSFQISNWWNHLPDRILQALLKGAQIQVIPGDYAVVLLPDAIRYAHESKDWNEGKLNYRDLRKINSPRAINF